MNTASYPAKMGFDTNLRGHDMIVRRVVGKSAFNSGRPLWMVCCNTCVKTIHECTTSFSAQFRDHICTLGSVINKEDFTALDMDIWQAIPKEYSEFEKEKTWMESGSTPESPRCVHDGKIGGPPGGWICAWCGKKWSDLMNPPKCAKPNDQIKDALKAVSNIIKPVDDTKFIIPKEMMPVHDRFRWTPEKGIEYRVLGDHWLPIKDLTDNLESACSIAYRHFMEKYWKLNTGIASPSDCPSYQIAQKWLSLLKPIVWKVDWNAWERQGNHGTIETWLLPEPPTHDKSTHETFTPWKRVLRTSKEV